MMKKYRILTSMLTCAIVCTSLVGCGGSGVEKPVEFLTAEVGQTYALPYWIADYAESVRMLSPNGKEVKSSTTGYRLETVGKYTLEYTVGGRKDSIVLHVADTKAPGFLPLSIDYAIAPDFSLYVNAGEELDLNDIFIATDNSGTVARQYYDVYEDGAFKVTLTNDSVFTPTLSEFYSVTAFAVDESGNVGKISHRLTVLPTVAGVIMENPDVEMAFGPNAKKEKTG